MIRGGAPQETQLSAAARAAAEGLAVPLGWPAGLFLGTSGGSWATTRRLWRSIGRRIGTLAVLKVRIEHARKTLAEMEETTWDVTLREIDRHRFVVMPAQLENTPWTVRDQPAVNVARVLEVLPRRWPERDHW